MRRAPSIFILAFLFFKISCSQLSDTGIHRQIANQISSPITLTELMTFKSTPVTYPGDDFTTSMKSTFTQPRGVKYEFSVDPLMSSENAFRIVPEIRNQEFLLKIYQSVNAKADRAACAQLERFLDIIFKQTLHSQFSFFELYFNAKAQDLDALHIMAKLRDKSLREAIKSPIAQQDVRKYINENADDYTSVLEDFNKVQRQKNKTVRQMTQTRKLVMDALDKANEDQQFRTMVAKNNRKGAVSLLKSYLPWELMPPVEKEFWEKHLSFMANPLPIEKRVFLYRGINDDEVQTGFGAGKKLELDNALKEQNIFLMSTMMTKNQGTWNRRLRSLSAMYDKYIATDEKGQSEFTKASRMMVMFKNHSSDPKGSPFLSFTPRFNISANFGFNRNTLYIVDPRLVYLNFASRFSNEVEYLMPLVTFPEDLGAVWDKKLLAKDPVLSNLNAEKYLNQVAFEKIEKIHGMKAKEIWKSIQHNTSVEFDHHIEFIGKNVLIDDSFLKIYRKLAGVTTEAATGAIPPSANLKCVDLVKEFWK